MYREMGMQIGEGTLIYPHVSFGRGGEDPIIIGKNCVLTGCTILGHDASTNRQLGITRSIRIPVIIEDDCFIGWGAIVMMGVRIGRGSIIGAGAVVTSDVPPNLLWQVTQREFFVQSVNWWQSANSCLLSILSIFQITHRISRID